MQSMMTPLQYLTCMNPCRTPTHSYRQDYFQSTVHAVNAHLSCVLQRCFAMSLSTTAIPSPSNEMWGAVT